MQAYGFATPDGRIISARLTHPRADSQISMRNSAGGLGETEGAELALVGRNLTDRVQRNAAAFNKDEILLPGRDIRLMVRATLGP